MEGLTSETAILIPEIIVSFLILPFIFGIYFILVAGYTDTLLINLMGG